MGMGIKKSAYAEVADNRGVFVIKDLRHVDKVKAQQHVHEHDGTGGAVERSERWGVKQVTDMHASEVKCTGIHNGLYDRIKEREVGGKDARGTKMGLRKITQTVDDEERNKRFLDVQGAFVPSMSIVAEMRALWKARNDAVLGDNTPSEQRDGD